MNFWSDFKSGNNSTVHTPQMVLFGIGTIVMVLSVILICYHSFYHGKGIDGETVKLILGLLGGGVLNAGASYLNKTVTSSVTAIGGVPRSDVPAAKKAPPQSEGET